MLKPKIILKTPRLYLREMTWEDLPALCKILQDKEVMYAYEHGFGRQECEKWLERQIKRYEQDGFGLWAVILKADDQMIGQCGLTYQNCDGKEVVEIGYLFQKAYWHQGYAIESADACKRYAFEQLQIDAVYSIIRDTNTASQKVAIKNGMQPQGSFVKHYHGIDMPHIYFSVTKDKI